MPEITKNDIVKLKSGGPEMRVIEVDTNDYAFCSWTNKRNDKMEGHFPFHVITKV